MFERNEYESGVPLYVWALLAYIVAALLLAIRATHTAQTALTIAREARASADCAHGIAFEAMRPQLERTDARATQTVAPATTETDKHRAE